MLYFLVEPIKAVNSIWFIGDEFLEKSFGKFLQNPSMENCYIRNNFVISAYTGYEKWNRSYVSRVRNCFVKAVNDNEAILPKYVILVLDNELVKEIKYEGFAYPQIYERLVKWLACQMDRAIRSTKDFLGNKSKRHFEPQVIWIEAPEHEKLYDVSKRWQYNKIIKEVSADHQEMKTLKPLKGWSYSDTELVSSSGNTYSADGAAKIWWAIDGALHFWDTHKANPLRVQGYVAKQQTEHRAQKRRKLDDNSNGGTNNYNRYHWDKYSTKY